MRMRRHIQEQHESSHGIDLAPMLDFVLNLLIFFIITAIFVKESGLLVNRPTSFQEPNPNDPESIVIEILNTGEIFVDNRVVDARAVRANVERAHAVSPQSGVLILADEDAPTGTVVEVVDQVHLGGIWNITFTTSE
jgi:biopolymer transport protein ExbD